MYTNIRTIFIGFLLSFAFLFIPLRARVHAAASWYVDNGATGTATGTSWQDAWKSLGTVDWSRVNPGDTVYISGGTGGKTYNEGIQISRSGSVGSPISIDSGAHSPNPQGHDGEVTINGTGYCIRSDGNYVTIRNLTCQNATQSGFYIRGTGSVVENNTVRNSTQQGIHVHYCTNCTVRNNRITTSDFVDMQTDGIVVYDSNNTLIEGNWIRVTNQSNCTGCHNDGIQSSTTIGTNYAGLTVRNNYVENTKVSTDNAQGIYLTQLQGTVEITGNIVLVPYGGQTVAVRLPNSQPVNVRVVGNTIKGGGYWTLRVDDDDPFIRNNVLIQTGGTEGYIRNGTVVRLDNRVSTGNPSNIDSNLMYAPYTAKTFSINGTSVDLAAWKGYGFDQHGKFQDPGLDSCMRPASGDSPSAGGGSVLDSAYGNGLSMEICGTNGPDGYLPIRVVARRSVNGSWGMGAYEYGVSGTATPTGTVAAAKTGDANKDGRVDQTDYTDYWLKNYKQMLTGPEYGDFNGNGVVDGVDYVLWMNNYSP